MEREREELGKAGKSPPRNVRLCISCGAVLPEGAKVCPQCGSEQVSRKSLPERAKYKSPGGGVAAMAGILAMGVLAVLLLFMPFYFVALGVGSSGFDLALGNFYYLGDRISLSVSYPVIWFILVTAGLAAFLGFVGALSFSHREWTPGSSASALIGGLVILLAIAELFASVAAYLQIQTDAASLRIAPAFGIGGPGPAIFGVVAMGIGMLILGIKVYLS